MSTEENLENVYWVVNGFIKVFLIVLVFFKGADFVGLVVLGVGWVDFVIVFYFYFIYFYFNFLGYIDVVIIVLWLCGMIIMLENFNWFYFVCNV